MTDLSSLVEQAKAGDHAAIDEMASRLRGSRLANLTIQVSTYDMANPDHVRIQLHDSSSVLSLTLHVDRLVVMDQRFQAAPFPLEDLRPKKYRQ